VLGECREINQQLHEYICEWRDEVLSRFDKLLADMEELYRLAEKLNSTSDPAKRRDLDEATAELETGQGIERPTPVVEDAPDE
jgi:uncharacterized coiled-coil DUF342 family protein